MLFFVVKIFFPKNNSYKIPILKKRRVFFVERQMMHHIVDLGRGSTHTRNTTNHVIISHYNERQVSQEWSSIRQKAKANNFYYFGMHVSLSLVLCTGSSSYFWSFAASFPFVPHIIRHIIIITWGADHQGNSISSLWRDGILMPLLIPQRYLSFVSILFKCIFVPI